jgi:hypothetical protein
VNFLLFRSGWVLIGLTLVQILFQVFPLKPFDPQWQLSFISGLLGNGPFLVVGTVLVCYSTRRENLLSQALWQAKFLRTSAAWLSLALLLLVPVQFLASTGIIKTNYFNGVATMRRLGKVIDKFRDAKDEQEFRDQISRFPELPPLPPKLETPFQEIRDTVVNSLTARRSAALVQLERTRNENLQLVIKESFRNSASLVLLSFGMMTVALSDPSHRTVVTTISALLDRLRTNNLWFSSPARRKTPAINKAWMDRNDDNKS